MTAQDWLQVLLPYVIPIIIAGSASTAILAYQHLLRYLPEKQREILEFAVSRAVSAVDQIMPLALPSDKKHEAMTRAQDILSHFGLQVPIAVIDTAIESSVGTLRAIQETNASQSSQNSGDGKTVGAPITSAIK